MRITYQVIMLIMLTYSTYTDIKNRQVMMLPIYAGFFVGVMGYFLPNTGETVSITGLIPGVVMLIAAKLSDGAIGDGDAYIVMVLGLFIGIRKTLDILFIGSVISTVFCIYIMKKKGKDKKYSIPFVPFLLSGYLGILIFAK